MEGTGVASAHDYVKPRRISLKNHPLLNEKWVQQLLAADPSILGLGDLVLLDKERQQPSGGRLDLLFADSEDEERYEVEVQLGATDPSHIVRTIEYWDIERARNRGPDHIAVLVAEDITSRFLNVISLLNRSVPIIAIQMQAIEVGSHLTLVFTTVVDLSARPGDDPRDAPASADRAYWEKKAKGVLPVVDKIFSLVQKLDPTLVLAYNLGYIQINKGGRVVVWFTPRKSLTGIGIKMGKTPDAEELKTQIEDAGLKVDYKEGRGGPSYKVFVSNEKFGEYATSIEKLISLGVKGSNDES